MIITEAIRNRYWRARIHLFLAPGIVRDLIPELRRAAHRKACSQATSVVEREAYAKCRAVQLAQPLVDSIVRDNPHIPAHLASRLVLDTATKAAAAVSTNGQRAKKAMRPSQPNPMWSTFGQTMARAVSIGYDSSRHSVALKGVLTLLIISTLVAAALGAGVLIGR